jgi:hypothetical protein
MLTNVKVQFGACLVDWRGNCPLARPLIRRGGGRLQGDERNEARCRKGNAMAELSFPTSAVYKGVSRRRAHLRWPRWAAELSREIKLKPTEPASEPEKARSALLAQQSAGPRPNQTHQRVRTRTLAPRPFIDEG